jgi:plastocyanin
VATGTTVTWSNDDTAAHTVTSGTPEGSDGLFDSSIFMAGTSFEFTFDEAGTYDYFCMVHPWMTGIIHVN